MFDAVARSIAALSLILRQPLTSFCDLDTAVGNHLLSRHGDCVSVFHVLGLRKMALREDVERAAGAIRLELSGIFETPGHVLQGCYVSDPARAVDEIRRGLDGMRIIARGLGADFNDLFGERERIWPRLMRWEACHLVVWTRKACLSRDESRQATDSAKPLSVGLPPLGDAQNPFRFNEPLAAKHEATLNRIKSAFSSQNVGLRLLDPEEALIHVRESIYPETAGSGWVPLLPGHDVMPLLPEDGEPPDASLLLWPPLAEQLFIGAAETEGSQLARLGAHDWTGIDMARGPEDPRPFAELASRLAAQHIPWRMAMLVESTGPNFMVWKKLVASLLALPGMPGNRDIKNAFDALALMRERQSDVTVKLRAAFATWAPTGESKRLRSRAAILAQSVEAWGNCRASALAGDPLDAVLSSAPALAVASTAPASAAPLADVLTMMPWSRQASPWENGSVFLRSPDGSISRYDPSGSRRKTVCDIFVAPSRFGKSVLSNTFLLGLILSAAAQTTDGIRFPLIGKLDVGESAEGLIELVLEALPEHLRELAIHVKMQLSPGFEYNVFDTQVGCRAPLPLEHSFLKNFLSLVCLPIGKDKPFEGMDHLIGFVIDEAYRKLSDDGNNIRPRIYRAGVDPRVDEALAYHGVHPAVDARWWDVVDALCERGAHGLAARAQRHAVPVMQDLISALQHKQITNRFSRVTMATGESLLEIFSRYLTTVIARYPTLNHFTRLDFGPARVIVLDLAAVAPTGSEESERQTDLMYLLGRQILARNFFLIPEYADLVPELVRPYHRRRFTEVFETFKRLEYDEYHRTRGRRFVRAQVELDRREGSKHNLHLGLSSQRLEDFGEDLISQSSGRFILGAGDDDEREAIIKRFKLSPASAAAVRTLRGPLPDGSGAPFLMLMTVDGHDYEQILVNSLGPIELWALSTTSGDAALRGRLYRNVGPGEARRRLARVFPKGTAVHEIDRRKAELMRKGQEEGQAEGSVIDKLADELTNGHGLGVVLRGVADDMVGARE